MLVYQSVLPQALRLCRTLLKKGTVISSTVRPPCRLIHTWSAEDRLRPLRGGQGDSCQQQSFRCPCFLVYVSTISVKMSTYHTQTMSNLEDFFSSQTHVTYISISVHYISKQPHQEIGEDLQWQLHLGIALQVRCQVGASKMPCAHSVFNLIPSGRDSGQLSEFFGLGNEETWILKIYEFPGPATSRGCFFGFSSKLKRLKRKTHWEVWSH